MFNLGGTDADKANIPAMPGFFFGASLDYAFSPIEGLTVEPGAYIYHYGKTYRFISDEKSYHVNYLSVPIDLKYAFPTGDEFGIAVFTGPRFNLGLGGNMFSTGQNYPGMRPIEAQWGIGLSATVQKAVVIRGGYDTGITKCIRDNKERGWNDENIHRNSFYIGVHFIF